MLEIGKTYKLYKIHDSFVFVMNPDPNIKQHTFNNDIALYLGNNIGPFGNQDCFLLNQEKVWLSPVLKDRPIIEEVEML